MRAPKMAPGRVFPEFFLTSRYGEAQWRKPKVQMGSPDLVVSSRLLGMHQQRSRSEPVVQDCGVQV